MKKLLFISTFAILAACNSKEGKKDTNDFSINGDTISINENSPILHKLETQRINLQSYSYESTATGTVNAIPSNYALVAAPFAGRITKSNVRLGQEIKAGAPIFEISSPSYYEAGKAHYQAKEEMDLALKNFKRQKDLLSKGVGVQRDYEEAEVNYALRKKDFESSLANLMVFQVDTSNLVLGQPLIVRSPINGTIVENSIVIGQYLKEDSEPMVVVADLSRVWIVAQVKEKYIELIKPGDSVKVSTNTQFAKTIKGTIYYFGEILDEETRSIEVIIECKNPERNLKLGMFCDVCFISSPTKEFILPSTAILKEQDNDYVLIEESKGKYYRRIVESETINSEKVLVKKGISEGDNVVIRGGFYLNM